MFLLTNYVICCKINLDLKNLNYFSKELKMVIKFLSNIFLFIIIFIIVRILVIKILSKIIINKLENK